MANNKKHHSTETKPVSLVTLIDQSSPVSEQYRTIRTNLQFASTVDSEIKTIAITSSGPGEGKSTTSANIAVVFANAGQRVLLVDADMRKPTVHKTFYLPNTRGLSNLLTSREAVADVTQSSIVPNLSILTSGPKPPNPSELLSSSRMNQLLSELREAFDVIIFDMPPIVQVADAQIMAAKVDGTMVVVREDVTMKDSLVKAKKLLEMANARVLGAVYHGAKNAAEQGYYYYGS